MDKLLNQSEAKRWLFLFIFLHLFLWTLVPWLIRYNLPMDAIEGTIWGQQLEWGYDKNPFLNGWLTGLATYLDGHSGFLIYFLSQLSVAICFWATWQLASAILPASYALIAVMLLESVQYYNFHAIDFNANNLELSLWALTTYCFYRALKSPTYFRWMLTGFFAGLGMMAKYYTAILLTSMVLLLFCHQTHRQQLKTLPSYIGLITFLLVIAPHLIWLCRHDFITVTYVFERTMSTPHWFNHIIFPTIFSLRQLQTFFPAILLALLLLIGPSSAPTFSVQSDDKAFLYYVGLGPFLITILLSLVFGFCLMNGWGMPLLSLWSIILLMYLKPSLSTRKLYRFCALIFSLMIIMVMVYSFVLTYIIKTSSANYPGKKIAFFLTNCWHDAFHTKLNYVAGSRFISGTIEFYSKDHPAVFVEWEKKRAPWINEEDFKKEGALFVWDDDLEKLPVKVLLHYPRLMNITILEFLPQHAKPHSKPIRIGIAILPPCKQNDHC